KVDIKTGTKARVFEAAADLDESFVAALDDNLSRIVVSRESPTQVPNAFLRAGTGTLTKLTDNKDYTPEFTNAIRKRVIAKRADGVSFEVNVVLPADYRTGTRLPAIFW